MRAPLLSVVLVLAVVTTVSLVPAVCNVSLAVEDGSEDTDAKKQEDGGSINPMSYSLAVQEDTDDKKQEDGGSINPMSYSFHVQDGSEDVTPRMTAEIYDQNPIKEQGAPATASTADQQTDQYVASLDPEQTAKKAKSDKSVEESVYAKKEKKEKKEKSDYLDESTLSKKEKKVKKEKLVKSDDSDNKKEQNDKWETLDVSATSKKKKKKAKTDDDVDEDATLTKKEKKEKSAASAKKHKKEKSVDDDSDGTSPKKAKKEKSIDTDPSFQYLKKKEKESSDSDEATSLKKQKKHKKKKKKHQEEENSDEDAAPVDVSTDGKYVSSTKDEEKPDSDATPVDVSTTTGQYVSSKADVELNKGGERQISNNAAPYASQKQDASSQPMAAGSPDELPPAAKSSATPDAYVAPKQPVVSSSSQTMAAGSPDELPPTAKKPTTFDPYASSKQQVFKSQPMAGGAPDELPPQAESSEPNEPGKPKLVVGTISGMINIKKPITQFLTPVIKSVCAKAEFPEDCEWSITTLPGAASAAATDSLGVLKLAMEAVREKVVVALNAAMDRMHAPGTDPTTKEALDSCTSSYSDIKSSLDTVNDALKSGDVNTATTNLDAVETDLTTCDQGFTDRGTPSVMKDHDDELVKLASNLLSIGQELKKQ